MRVELAVVVRGRGGAMAVLAEAVAVAAVAEVAAAVVVVAAAVVMMVMMVTNGWSAITSYSSATSSNKPRETLSMRRRGSTGTHRMHNSGNGFLP